MCTLHVFVKPLNQEKATNTFPDSRLVLTQPSSPAETRSKQTGEEGFFVFFAFHSGSVHTPPYFICLATYLMSAVTQSLWPCLEAPESFACCNAVLIGAVSESASCCVYLRIRAWNHSVVPTRTFSCHSWNSQGLCPVFVRQPWQTTISQ